jgi:hypothetical protein
VDEAVDVTVDADEGDSFQTACFSTTFGRRMSSQAAFESPNDEMFRTVELQERHSNPADRSLPDDHFIFPPKMLRP